MQRILLAHGGGGEEMHALINDLILIMKFYARKMTARFWR